MGRGWEGNEKEKEKQQKGEHTSDISTDCVRQTIKAETQENIAKPNRERVLLAN